MSVSALGAAASGAGNLIGAVSNLLPQSTSTKGKTNTKASASALTEGGQLDLSKSSTSNIGTSQSNTSDMRTNSSQGFEDTRSSTSSTTNTTSSEKFSGQNNQETSQTLVSDEGIMRIMTMALQGDQSGFGGLQQLVSGERSAGLFNSSTNQMLVNDLLTRVAGEAERLSAKTVNNQTLGATSTDTNTTSKTLVDAVTSAMSRLSERSAGSSGTTGRTQTQENTDSGLLSLAQQLNQQESESESVTSSKSKSKIGFSAVGMVVFGLMGATKDNDTYRTLQSFASNHLSVKEKVAYYKFSERFANHVNSLPGYEKPYALTELNVQYLQPMVVATKEGNLAKAKDTFKSMIKAV